MEQKPLPLAGGEEAEYLLALKQDFRGVMKNLPFFIKPAAAQRGHTRAHTHARTHTRSLILKVLLSSCADVQRYSDKYHSSEQTNSLTDWNLGETPLPR